VKINDNLISSKEGGKSYGEKVGNGRWALSHR